MRKKKQREEELARAVAQSPEGPFRDGGRMDVVVSNAPSETPCSPGVIDGANEATADIATPKAHTVSVLVTEPTDTYVDSTPTLYNVPINDVHFDEDAYMRQNASMSHDGPHLVGDLSEFGDISEAPISFDPGSMYIEGNKSQ
jgi:hypothetical protein